MATGARRARTVSFVLTAVFLATTADWTTAAGATTESGLAPTTLESAPDPDRPGTELVDRRTATSDTFDLGNGSFSTTLYSEPVYYQPAGQSGFDPIAVGFEPVGATDAAVTSSHGPATVTVAPAADPRGFVSLAAGGYTIRLKPLPGAPLSAAAEAAPSPDGTVADLAEAIPGVGLRVLARPDGVVVVQEGATAFATGIAIGASVVAPNPVIVGLATLTGANLLYNAPYTYGTAAYCLGGPLPKSPSTIFLPWNFPP